MSDHSLKQKILITDDSEMNRMMLADMLEDEFDILEAENGQEAIEILHEQGINIALVLLDVVMPKMNGLEVLEIMRRKRWIDDIPVIMISSESGPTEVKRAYDLGAVDFIARPFDPLIVHRRVVNTILLYAKQKKLIAMVAEQVYENERRSSMMIDILSHAVEFRNGESGLHVLYVRKLTELILLHLTEKTNKYQLSKMDISIISTASALHDIGKIAIDEKILNKPGRLTQEEFEIMKTHSMVGAKMLENLSVHQDEPLIKFSYEICRWHHERYNGKGYPDGLVGDEIPISAQVVALADVYNALTSERVYKKAFSHEKAIDMILNGECGVFNPLLLECLQEMADSLQEDLEKSMEAGENHYMIRDFTKEVLQRAEVEVTERTLAMAEAGVHENIINTEG